MISVILRRRRSSPPEPGAKPEQPDYAPLVEHARFLVNWYWLVSDGFERKAAQMLAFDGVIIALLPNTFGPMKDLSGAASVVARAFLIAALCTLVVAALCCVGALWSRFVTTPGTQRLREDWQLRTTAKLDGRSGTESIGMALLDGGEDGVLPELQHDTKHRGRWMTAAFAVTAFGLAILAVPVAILTQQAVG